MSRSGGTPFAPVIMMKAKRRPPSGRDLQRPWVMRVPVLSTAHIKRDTLEKLASEEEYLVLDYEEGAIVRISPRDYSSNPPPEIRHLVKWFRRAFPKQWWIRFDRDGDEIPGLPVYDW